MSGSAQKDGPMAQAHQDNVEPITKTTQATSSAQDGTSTAPERTSSQDEQDAPEGSDRAAGSPEPNCAICLGALENKSFTDSCFHMFCFVCLQEWSKVKPECPLCKQPFKSIIHNVKSYNNYDQFYLDHPRPAPQPMHFDWNFDRSFRYRTTLTVDHRYFSLLNPRVDHAFDMLHRPSLLPRYRLRSRAVLQSTSHGRRTTSEARRQIYEMGRWVSGVRTTQRTRMVSPEFYRRNPAQTHRLVPWLNRELNALLYNSETQVTFVMELIMDLVKRFAIDSEEFFQHINPYLHQYTRHFMHEFLMFARSPLTMSHYDARAIYEEASHTLSSPGSSSSDVVVVDDEDVEMQETDQLRPAAPLNSNLTYYNNLYHGMPLPSHSLSRSRWDSPVNIENSSDSDTSTTNINRIFVSPSQSLSRSHWDSPTPGPSWDVSGNSSNSPVNVDGSSDSDASTIINPAYISPEHSSSQLTRAASPQSSDGEDIIFVSYDKPWEERSPIQLSSDSDEKSLSHFVRTLKQEHNRKKKIRHSEGTSQSARGDGHRDRSRSLTPPPVHFGEEAVSTYGNVSCHDLGVPSLSRTRLRKKRRHHNSKEDSGCTSHKEKRKHSTSTSRSTFRSKVPHKKRRPQEQVVTEEREQASTSASHKHKKHKKVKDRSAKHSKRKQSDQSRSSSLKVPESANAATMAERTDHCKKHPSGHKKSKVEDADQGNGQDTREGSNGGHSDSLLSDASTSSCSSIVTSSSLTDSEPTSASRISRQQRVQQVLQERQQRQTHPFPILPGMDITPSWDNITMLAGVIASHVPPKHPPGPGPSQSASDPVVISTSSDDSDVEAGNTMTVANTVVVPGSSYLTTPIVDAPSNISQPMDEDYIDVDSISSEDEVSDSEVVDVESLADIEDSKVGCNAGQPLTADSTGAVSEISAEAEHLSSPLLKVQMSAPAVESRAHPFSIQSILSGGVRTSLLSQSRQTATSSNLHLPSSSKDVVFAHSLLCSQLEQGRQLNQGQQQSAAHGLTLSQVLQQHWQSSTPRNPSHSLFSQQGPSLGHGSSKSDVTELSVRSQNDGSKCVSNQSNNDSDVNCLTDSEDELLGGPGTGDISLGTDDDIDVMNDSFLHVDSDDVNEFKQRDCAQQVPEPSGIPASSVALLDPVSLNTEAKDIEDGDMHVVSQFARIDAISPGEDNGPLNDVDIQTGICSLPTHSGVTHSKQNRDTPSTEDGHIDANSIFCTDMSKSEDSLENLLHSQNLNSRESSSYHLFRDTTAVASPTSTEKSAVTFSLVSDEVTEHTDFCVPFGEAECDKLGVDRSAKAAKQLDTTMPFGETKDDKLLVDGSDKTTERSDTCLSPREAEHNKLVDGSDKTAERLDICMPFEGVEREKLEVAESDTAMEQADVCQPH